MAKKKDKSKSEKKQTKKQIAPVVETAAAEADVEVIVCETEQVHKDVIDTVADKMPDDDTLFDLAELFKVFGDSTRVRILYALMQSEMCVCDIAELLDMTQSAISHQLRVLKQSKLVKNRREGKSIIYSLADHHVFSIIEQGMTHINE